MNREQRSLVAAFITEHSELTYAAISKIYHCHVTSIGAVAVEFGVTRLTGAKNRFDHAAILTYIKENESVPYFDVATKFGCSLATIRDLTAKHHIRRPRGPKPTVKPVVL